MRGLRLGGLLKHYGDLLDRQGLDILCVQENQSVETSGADGTQPAENKSHADAIAAFLGPHYAAHYHDDFPALAAVVDTRSLSITGSELVALPRLAALSWFEKLYIVGGKTKQKYAHLMRVEPRRGAPFCLVNAHLDTAGGNIHRAAQIEAIGNALRSRSLADRFCLCGDTNAFGWRPSRQRQQLDQLLAPLSALGASDRGDQPTHFFARQNEPKLSHRAVVAIGKLGLDLPRRYDVVCTNLATTRRGQVTTPDSDHDLVWAAVDYLGRSEVARASSIRPPGGFSEAPPASGEHQ